MAVDALPGRAERAARPSLRPAVAVMLVVLGLGFVVLWRIGAGTERHSWDADAVPPAFVTLTAGRSYAISVPGGVPAEQSDGVSPESLSCKAEGDGITAQQLSLSPEATGTNATDQIASFVSPVTGPVTITCQGLSRVFVDDADDAGFDFAGLLLWLGIAALVVGVPLGLSVLRDSARAGDEDQVEGSVDVTPDVTADVTVGEYEVVRPDRGDGQT